MEDNYKVLFNKLDLYEGVKKVSENLNVAFEYFSVKGKHPLYVCIMDGAVPFFKDVTRNLPNGEVIYISAKSYGNSQAIKSASLSDVRIESHPYKHVDFSKIDCIVIFDDICDSGNTLKKVAKAVHKESAAQTSDVVQIFSAVMFNRVRDDKVFEPFTFGISLESTKFLAGYGLDDKGMSRNLPFVYDCTPEE